MIEKFDWNILKGQFYLLKHNEKAKIKEVIKTWNGYILHSLNPDYPDVEVYSWEELDIIWVVRINWVKI